MTRHQSLQEWLTTTCQLDNFELQALPGDASFRRYFRLAQGDRTYMAMDAPPATENCVPFLAIAKALKTLGLSTPDIFHYDLQQGYLLLADFGDRVYLRELNPENAEKLYDTALNALSTLQTCTHVSDWTVPIFTKEFMRKELELFREWFLQRYLQATFTSQQEKKLSDCFDFLAQACAEQPRVFMHRDYHSANLMVLPNHQVGILDFQDAFYGPVTYDLASLLRDCYIAWPPEQVRKWALNFREKINLSVSNDEFLRWFDVMSLQRHLKALLTFSRKFCRDQNSSYLQHIPRTVNYIHQVSDAYPECAILKEVVLCAE